MGVPIRTEHLYTFSFVIDQEIIAQDEEELSHMVRKLEEEYNRNGREININKTEYDGTGNHKTSGNRRWTRYKRNGPI